MTRTDRTYEVHITMSEVPDTLSLKSLLLTYFWHYAKIDGDPQLGDRVYHYATVIYTGGWEILEVRDRMEAMAIRLKEIGCKIVRKKIQHIVFDSRILKEGATL